MSIGFQISNSIHFVSLQKHQLPLTKAIESLMGHHHCCRREAPSSYPVLVFLAVVVVLLLLSSLISLRPGINLSPEELYTKNPESTSTSRSFAPRSLCDALIVQEVDDPVDVRWLGMWAGLLPGLGWVLAYQFHDGTALRGLFESLKEYCLQ
ncbi:hypothetical protein DVH24_004487 [Malus domestica]|uniref:Uncharacterized protein n=1 Tax=Malus domestica TaxID=3750 RepID=A0A498IH62_MALDO|nr:hypothetical protein DVH24_004487 [Malus domestica]